MKDSEIARIAVEEGLLSTVELDRVIAEPASRTTGLLHTLVDAGLLRTSDVERIKRDHSHKSTTKIPGEIVTTSHTRVVPPEVADAQRDPRSAFGRYTLIERIGSGGMGAIWKAWDNLLGRWAAIKMLHEEHARHDDHRERFLREARAAARLAHPNIVQVYEVGAEADTVFIALEYVPGETLRSRIQTRATGPELRRRVELVRQAAEGLGSAHEAGITHRDMKPENVLVIPTPKGGQAKVVDFGLAVDRTVVTRLTIAGDVFGTPSYMAPEQALGLQEIVGPPADVFAVGVILYEMLTGKLPFDADQAAASVYATIHSEPEPVRKSSPKVHEDLETIVMKCLEKDPPRRYADARELALDLGRYMSGEPIQARPIGLWGRTRRKVERNPALAAALAAAILLPSALLGIFVWRNIAELQTIERDLEQAAELEEKAAKSPGLLPSAKVLYESILRDDPGNERAHEGLSRVVRAIAARPPEDLDGGAGDWSREAFRRDLEETRAAMADPVQGAVASALSTRLLARWPEEPMAHELRGEILWRQGAPGAAVGILNGAAHRWVETRRGRHLRILSMIESGRLQEVQPLMGAEKEGDQLVHTELAALRLAQGRLAEARESLARVKETTVESAWIAGRIAAKTGGAAEGVVPLEEAVRLDRGFLPAHLALVRVLLGSGRAGAGAERARELVDLAPGMVAGRLVLAEALMAGGDAAGAVRELERAWRLEPSMPIRRLRGHARIAAGDPAGWQDLLP
ncbi:MAG: protein kinase [Candidatus Brocadiae bacterium]|nr:protein kinase [Candidatus Brocadiia bacterium]